MTMSSTPNAQVEKLKQYHDYLEKNFKCGTERFFSPTGALKNFERSIKLSAKKNRDVVIAKSVDEAEVKMRSVVNGGEGVFDLAAEPGSGKTSVLPFKFATKRVVVALPTMFDAWSAFQMATGEAQLRLKGLKLGSNDRVCYMDSYLAANMVMSGFMDYDIMIVDECDSGKGVTRFLADVAAPGKVIIRMSASHGRTQSGPSRSFPVTEDTDLPDVRDGVDAFVQAAKKKVSKRTLILMPDAVSAKEVADKLPGSRLVTSSSRLEAIAVAVMDQKSDGIYVADDVCARGLNLNLDVLIDSQLITEHGVTRNLSDAELYQRKGRVGRNKPGWYVSPQLPTMKNRESEADIFRSNVMRAAAGIPQEGPESVRLTAKQADELVCATSEPLFVHRETVRSRAASVEDEDRSAGTRSSSSSSHHRRRRSTSRRSSGDTSPTGYSSPTGSPRSSVSTPSWLSWLSPAVEKHNGKSYYVSESPARTTLVKRNDVITSPLALRPRPSRGNSELLPVAEHAPYALVPRARAMPLVSALRLPDAPPVVDLTEVQYHMDWPAAIRDCLASGRELPSIVPPGNWRHTSAGGMGTNWMARLESISVSELTFVDSEFEVVCRAWNKMVAQAWVKRTPGLSSFDMEDRLEFCVRYFQSYFQMLTL